MLNMKSQLRPDVTLPASSPSSFLHSRDNALLASSVARFNLQEWNRHSASNALGANIGELHTASMNDRFIQRVARTI